MSSSASRTDPCTGRRSRPAGRGRGGGRLREHLQAVGGGRGRARRVRPGPPGHHGDRGVDGRGRANDGGRAVRPDHLEVAFGIKLAASGKVIVAGLSAEATLAVKVAYDAPKPAAP
ncbi:MAG: CU044_2847 family protein [Acidimicrobiales bacterium]